MHKKLQIMAIYDKSTVKSHSLFRPGGLRVLRVWIPPTFVGICTIAWNHSCATFWPALMKWCGTGRSIFWHWMVERCLEMRSRTRWVVSPTYMRPQGLLSRYITKDVSQVKKPLTGNFLPVWDESHTHFESRSSTDCSSSIEMSLI